MRTIYQDLRYGIRVLRRNPGFTAVAVLTLALGVGASTAIYSIVDATLLRPLPFKDPDRLMLVSLTTPVAPNTPFDEDVPWSYPKYTTFRELQQVFVDTAAYQSGRFKLTGSGEPEKISGEFAGASYFPILGVKPELGRVFLPEDDTTPGTHAVAVVGHGLWQRRFGGDPATVGRTVTLDGKSYILIGVAPAGFRGLTGRAEVWVPNMMYDPQALKRRWSHSWQVVARVKPGVSKEQAKATVVVLGRQVDEAHPAGRGSAKGGAKARTLRDVRVEPAVRRSVLVLFGAVGFVLLVACVNVTNLLLARGASRQREIAIRQAVGASRGRLVRQLLTESALLAFLGGLGGLALAWCGLGALNALDLAAADTFHSEMPGLTLIGLSSIRIDVNVLVFTFGLTLATCLLFGLAPALRALRPDLVDTLKGGAPHMTGWGGPRLLTTRHVLVVTEVALAATLLAGAGLMIKSFGRLAGVRTGIDAGNLLTVSLDASGQYDEKTSTAFFDELEARISGLPGVVSVGMRDSYPLSGCCSMTVFWHRDRANPPAGSEPIVGTYNVSPSYFKTMRIPLVRGRWFTTADRRGAPKVVAISETAAHRFWPGEDPIGKLIGVSDGTFDDRAEVIGVVGDVRNMPPDGPDVPAVYISYLQEPQAGPRVIFVRSAGDPAVLAPLARQQIRAVNGNVIITDSKTMRERIAEVASKARFSATLLGVFALIAFVLAAVGIYGVISYSVAQRTREMGIRLALGARPGDLVGLILRHGLGLTLAGIAIGAAGALGLTRLMASLLYEVKPSDAPTYALTAAVLGAVALLACYIPARRAASADALAALKTE